MNWCKIGNLAALSLTLIFAACGDDDKSSSTASEEQSYASKEDLPSCTPSRDAEVVSTDDGKIYVCIDDSWQKVDYSENSVDDLPSCTENRDGNIAYLSSKEKLVICKNEKWQKKESKDSNDAKQSSSSNSPNSSNGAKKDSLASSSSCSAVQSSSSVQASYNEVKNKSDLGKCDSSKKDLRTLVLADSSYYTCNAKEWKKDETYLGYIVVSDREYLPQCNAGIGKQRAFAKKDSVFFVCDSVKWDAETIDGYVVKSASIMGAAHKGPFKFDSPLLLREMFLRNDSLIYSGRKYVDEISSNKGDFVIPKVKMIYPYAELEVCGLWRNEISGEWSKDTMTLRVLTDLSDRSNVNINLLTHLEYDRAVSLVNKGYSVFAAKKQADHEIMTAFGFAETVEHSEDLKTFAKDADFTLMAISLLFIGNRSDSEIQETIDAFRKDIADDGEWNGPNAETLKAEMADWAESFDDTPVSANVKSWGFEGVAQYPKYLNIFWSFVYGLGECSKNRYGNVVKNTNKLSKNRYTYYICETDNWRKATDVEMDTYDWDKGEEGEIRCCGHVNEHTAYGYENGAWRSITKLEGEHGICTVEKEGKIVAGTGYYVCENKTWKSITREEYILGFCTATKEETFIKTNNLYYSNRDSVYYMCKDGKWNELTELECDTYGWENGEDGNVKCGNCNANKYYVFENGKWRASANSTENQLGACVISRDGEIGKIYNNYYLCENQKWTSISALDYELGRCESSKDGTVSKFNKSYYICKSGRGWIEATTVEIDTYGKTCLTDGSIVSGSVWPENKYVCDKNGSNASFRTAKNAEIDFDKGCVYFTSGTRFRKQVSDERDSVYVCEHKSMVGYSWIGYLANHITYGSLLDERDHKTYKTVVIGNQAWMAENLNYEYNRGSARSFCYNNSVDDCEMYGRLYTWSAAMDSVGDFSTKGKGCGRIWSYLELSSCNSRLPIRGICPEGWHLPDTTEWRTLISEVGENASQKLKSMDSWNGIDAFGFAVLPSGYGNRSYTQNGEFIEVSFEKQMNEDDYPETRFWSSTSYSLWVDHYDQYYSDLNAYAIEFDGDSYSFYRRDKEDKYSVRCVKDSN